MLECQKQAFSLDSDVHYINCAYMSPLAKRVEEAGIGGIRRKRSPNRISARDFFDETDEARHLFARLIGGQPERVAIIPAASYGIAIVARNTPVSGGQNIVLSEGQFPSNTHAWRKLARKSGAELRTISAPDSANRAEEWNARLLEAIDDRTALVALPQVHWTDGTCFDLELLGERAADKGAAFVIDGTQSVGAFPFELARIRADAVICAGYKWLLGPYSIGAAWLGPRYDAGEPLEETWIGRAGSEDFRALVNYRDDYRPGAARFDVGEPSNFALMPMLIEGLKLVLEWTPAAIQQYCRTWLGEALEEARSLGFGVEADRWRASHLFGLRAPRGLDLAALQAALQRRNVSVSLRGSALRVSPHVYNDDADREALLEVLREQTIATSSV
jgi:selenocysteine lyase/cysteine desulfurase